MARRIPEVDQDDDVEARYRVRAIIYGDRDGRVVLVIVFFLGGGMDEIWCLCLFFPGRMEYNECNIYIYVYVTAEDVNMWK